MDILIEAKLKHELVSLWFHTSAYASHLPPKHLSQAVLVYSVWLITEWNNKHTTSVTSALLVFLKWLFLSNFEGPLTSLLVPFGFSSGVSGSELENQVSLQFYQIPKLSGPDLDI